MSIRGAVALYGASDRTEPAAPTPPASTPLSVPLLLGSVVKDETWKVFTTGTLEPRAGSLLIGVAATRNGTADRLHGTPTVSGITLATPFAPVVSRNINPASTTNLRVSIFQAVAGATPGTGTATMETNANVGEGMFAVLDIEGWTELLTSGLADNASGTTLALPMDDATTPPVPSVAIFVAIGNGTGGSALTASGFTMFEALTTVLSSGRYGVGYDLTSPPSSWTINNFQNNSGKVAGGVIIEGNPET